MRLFISALFLPVLASAAIWPDAIGPYQRTATTKTTLQDGPVWAELGLKAAETAAYEGAGKRFTATAYQLLDSTAALSAFDWQRNALATPSKAAALAAETSDGLLLTHGNYLLSFSGYKPAAPELEQVTDALRAVDSTGLPTLPGYLPSEHLVANSERYIIGPASLHAFVPGIPPSVAAFHLSAEAQLGVFQSSKGPMTLTIFRYPTNQIAMQRVADFEKLPGAVAKRSGPLVAILLSPPDPDAAERLLAQVRYQAEITDSEYVPTRRDNIGNLVINAFILTGILGAFSIVSGLCVGGVRTLLRRGKRGEMIEELTLLHLERR